MKIERYFRNMRLGIAAAICLAPGALHAAGSVAWISPPDNSTFPVGTVVSPTGIANARGTVGGTGLDLALVLDSSGSMGTGVDTDGDGVNDTTRQELQQQAALALVNALPDFARISVTEFDTNAVLLQGLTPLDAGGRGTTAAAINSVDASGGTNLAAGVNTGRAELVANGAAGSAQRLLLISDGESSSTSATNAAAIAAAAGITVDTVGFPGTDAPTLSAIAAAGGGTFFDFSGNPGDIIAAFAGTGGGTPVGIDSIQITDPLGVTYNVGAGILGNFTAAGFGLALGNNVFSVLANFTDGTSATATLNLIGVGDLPQVPLPASGLLLLASLAGIGAMRRRNRG
ncbi:von Willebrand factor type A domain-containing protein [Oceaniovalibus guishaninsula JLT2003]|uniref:von Willebrand factor type A domain-containing protein n=1 Tax=Oceaniovalibus guishaninsula JLT2003 TaxID=1231392 RepID=K2HDE9_9RHOB|nr:vWA domain-containing protein [Oceaniovalibus guishaninsula]EKE45483.1 von Willebrand factor type A domain-containing protein [Oceaniovalibus guishaninsula JLT2003]